MVVYNLWTQLIPISLRHTSFGKERSLLQIEQSQGQEKTLEYTKNTKFKCRSQLSFQFRNQFIICIGIQYVIDIYQNHQELVIKMFDKHSTITKLLLKSQTGQSCRNLDEPFVWKFASSRKLCSGNRYWRWMKLECEESEESSLDWREITERAGNITLIPYKLVKQNQDIFPNCLWSLIWLKCKVQCIFLTKVNQKIIQYKLEWKTGLNQSTYI